MESFGRGRGGWSLKKHWTSASIRELARKRMRASDPSSVPLEVDPLLPPKHVPEPEPDPLKMRYNPQESKLEWMWGRFEKSCGNRVVLSVPDEDRDGGEEMQLLCNTLGLEVVHTDYYSVREPIASTYLSGGTVTRLKELAIAHEAAAVVLDAPLSPGQVRNIEEEIQTALVDRQGVILAIFELHAKTRLAKMQVELARLKYLQPRLAGLWMGLSRQSGGKGGRGGRGLGETRLELDRRVVRDRISTLTRKLKDSERVHAVQSAQRHDLPRVALVGYTNAGKSTLMRALTRAEVGVEDKLFSTLGTTVRPMLPPTEPKVLISDTIGFVRDLPHDLVASFKSTLQEVLESRLILHVVDVSHPLWREHAQTTDSVLSEIGAAQIPRVLVLNKSDKMASARLRESDVINFMQGREEYIDRILVSALVGKGLEGLKKRITGYFGATAPLWRGLGD